MDNTEPYVVALIRGIIGALIVGGGAFFSTLSLTDATTETAWIAAGAAAFGFLAVRFAGEGTIDHRNAQK